MTTRSQTPLWKKPLPRWIGESLLIVLSVILALFLNEYRASIKDRALRRVALDNVKAEMQKNLEIFRAWHPYHREVLDNFAAALGDPSTQEKLVTAQGVVLWRLMPRGLVQTLPSHTAWGTLESSPIVTDLDFETLMTLSRVYDLQRVGVEDTIDLLKNELSSRETMDEEQLGSTLVLFHRSLLELTSQEEFLIAHIESAMAEIDWDVGD